MSASHHHRTEKDAASFTVYPEEGVAIHELEASIRELKMPQVKWAEKFTTDDVAFGITALKVGAIIENDSLDSDVIMDQVILVPDSARRGLGEPALEFL